MTLLNRARARSDREWFRRGILRAVFHSGAYALWVVLFRLLAITLFTYFLLTPTTQDQVKFQDISESFASNEITLLALGAFLYVLLLRRLNPLTSTTLEEIFSAHRFEKKFIPGFVYGSVLALSVVLVFIVSGLYRYLGVLIQLEEAPLAILSIGLRILALVALIYCEEFIFRHKVLNYLRQSMPLIWAVTFSSLAYGGIKLLQFDLGITQFLTVFLISLTLGVRAVVDGDFTRGAGMWAAILVVFHPLLSLPIFGSEFQGVLLVKAQLSPTGAESFRWLTGGLGGPLSALAVQVLFILDLGQAIVKNRKILLR